jgi:hypothetical protein
MLREQIYSDIKYDHPPTKTNKDVKGRDLLKYYNWTPKHEKMQKQEEITIRNKTPIVRNAKLQEEKNIFKNKSYFSKTHEYTRKKQIRR